ncbi:MAG: hypothetical protein QW761_00650 [Candidatus Aenigmatarchaeota archaeon]
MPEFIPVLIVAVLIFAGLLLAFGAVVTVPPSPQPHVGGGLTEEYRHIPISGNFSVGYVSAELPVANISGTVSRGLLSGEDKAYSFLISDPASVTGGHVILHVNDSNLYGRLIVALNGQELYNDYAYPGDHSIVFGQGLLKEENLLEIKAESSGWSFWAKQLSKITRAPRGKGKFAFEKSFNFTLESKDVALATKGRLVMNVKRREGTGQLNVTLNNENIYMGTSMNIVKDFTPDKFVVGTNYIKISAPAGTRYTIDSAEIIIYFT